MIGVIVEFSNRGKYPVFERRADRPFARDRIGDRSN